jgi:hypothetical protein
MRRTSITVVLALATLLFVSTSSAQQAATTAVPNLIRYGGTLKDAQGAALSSTTPVGITFAIYKQQDGGAAVWQETQNVTPDASGQYSVILGSTTSAGLPDDLFSQQEQRWLGVQIQGQAEAARVLLVSVPYAFKAHEAETLGGLPASAFVKAPPSDTPGSAGTDTGTAVNALNTAVTSHSIALPPITTVPVVAGNPCPSSTLNPAVMVIPIFTTLGASDLLCDSVIQQSTFTAGASVGIGKFPVSTAANPVELDVNGNVNVNNTKNAYQVGDTTVLSIFGLGNLFVGAGAGPVNTGSLNAFVGANAGGSNVFGGANSFFGSAAGFSNVNGGHNAFFGEDAGFSNVNGNFNAFFGADAGRANVHGNFNAFFGEGAGGNVSGNSNTFVGFASGLYNTADNNTFVGSLAGEFNTSGTPNTCVGYAACRGVNNLVNSGAANTVVGYQAGYSNTVGTGNTVMGDSAGYSNLTDNNSFYGHRAGFSNTTGTYNSFFGRESGGSNTTGYFNAFYGQGAGEDNITGSSNTYLGANAGSGGGNTAGSNNVYVGWEVGEGVGNGNSNIEIGAFGEFADDHTTRIGDIQTATFIAGIFASTAPPAAGDLVVCVKPTGELYGATFATGCAPSSRRFKENILDMGDSSSKLFQLHPVTFFYKPQYDDGSHLLQYGLIAEEVARVYPEMAAYDKDGQPYAVRYQMLAPMLLNEMQKQHTVVAAQQDVIRGQQGQMQAQQQQIEQLQQRLSRLEALIVNK